MLRTLSTFLCFLMLSGHMAYSSDRIGQKDQEGKNGYAPISIYSAKSAKAFQRGASYSSGIGLRLGDLTGITYKKYMGNNALEISFGRGNVFYGTGYHRHYYNRWHKDWYRKHPTYRDFDYTGYRASTPIALQIHYLFNKDIGSVDGLQWYWGLGAQFRHQSFHYNYRYRLHNSTPWYYDSDRFTNIDLGVDGVLGIEYTLPGIPLSFFADMTLFMEVFDDPFRFWFQGGVGGRFNF